jgi:hypothetical protein
VTETNWARFVDREIAPRFPDGLSVVDAKQQWRVRRATPSCASRASS